MALDSIVRGTDWRAAITVEAAKGETEDEVVAALTGATVSFDLRFRGEVAATGAATVDADARMIEISFANAATAVLETGPHDIDVRVTTTTPEIIPVKVNERTVEVRDFA